MTTDRKRQRERLSELHAEWEAAGDSEPRQLSTFLLDNGVSVEVPDPGVAIGTHGTVTLANKAQYPAIRSEVGYIYVDETGVGGYATDDEAEFTPDPEPLTAEAVEKVALAMFPGSGVDEAGRIEIRQHLAPYVAGGAR